MGGKIADNKRRICITLRKDLAEQGRTLAESEGLTFTAFLTRLLALAVKKSKES